MATENSIPQGVEVYRRETSEFVDSFENEEAALVYLYNKDWRDIFGEQIPPPERSVMPDGTIFFGNFYIVSAIADKIVLDLAHKDGWTLQHLTPEQCKQMDFAPEEWLLTTPNGYKFFEAWETGCIALLKQHYRYGNLLFTDPPPFVQFQSDKS